MSFKKILVALDGAKNSQIAADYGFWLASGLNAQLAGQHVIDPRLVDLFVEPEFAQELGFAQSIETSEKVFTAIRRIGNVILDLFAKEAMSRSLKTTVFLDEGYVADAILNYAAEFDLLVMGHRGREQRQLPSHLMLGSVAERVVSCSKVPVLISVQPVSEIAQVLVAYDGSEASRGALIMAEELCKCIERPLRVISVVASSSHEKEQIRVLIEQAHSYLRDKHDQDIFVTKYNDGSVSQEIMKFAESSSSLLVAGAYGFQDPDRNTLGSTTTKLLHGLKTTMLVYKPAVTASKKREPELLKRIYS
jgi:nucleotide-binding universal stress UspA family protein